MKNVLMFCGEMALCFLGNFQGLCSSRWESEHCSLPGNLCTLALPMAAAAPAQESQEEGLQWFSPPAHAGCPCGGSRLAFGLGWGGMLRMRGDAEDVEGCWGCEEMLRVWGDAEALSTAGPWPGAHLLELPCERHLPVWEVWGEGCCAAGPDQHRDQWGGPGGVRDPAALAGNWRQGRNRSSI